MTSFVGPSYPLANSKADVQRLVNLYYVVSEVTGGKSIDHLQSVPGLDVFSLPSLIYTSWLYPVDVQDIVNTSLVPVMGRLWQQPFESVDTSLIPIGGTLATAVNQYTFQLPEAVNTALIPLSGALVNIVNQYTFQLPEAVNTSLVPVGGSLVVVLVAYTYQLPEAVNTSLIPIGGTLA